MKKVLIYIIALLIFINIIFLKSIIDKQNKNIPYPIHRADHIEFKPLNYCSVTWEIPILETNNTENIVSRAEREKPEYTQEDVELLTRLIQSEAIGEPYEGQVAVGAVVMNRVKSDQFPNTIKEVIYQKSQFSGVGGKLFNQELDESCKQAAIEALEGIDPTGGALYFCNPKICNPYWIKYFKCVKVIGNHSFYK